MFSLHSDHVYRSDVLENLPWLRHGFGTRLCPEWPSLKGLTSVRQIHSNQVIVTGDRIGVLGEGDALISDRAGTFLSVRTADCFPILIADVRKRAVAAVHAGWRGTISEITTNTVRAMEREYGSTREDLLAVIGPGIGPCCFEVGPEVAVRFGTLFPERNDLLGRTKLNLAEANRRQLIAEGLTPESISTAVVCTCCGTDVYHSYRRDRERSGRMISGIGIRI